MRAMQRLSPAVTALSLALLAGLAACQKPATNANAPEAAPAPSATTAPAAETAPTAATTTKAPTDLEQLAGRVVTQSAGVKEGEEGSG
jgi:hypothetical protein